ncbi:MAG: [FeFe] hydrogenase, group A [Candidatus Sumerlaeales bacterium]|nr:[FeFe] hydrogenase, group A [Candidatus Sumerlaeales bacterium]
MATTNTTDKKFINIDGCDIPLEGEKNLLEVIRKAGIDLPTFCYNSDLSVYGACRLCIVDIQGRGINSSCSTPPEAGMVVKTNTAELRNIRKITIELLLANHANDCTTCVKSYDCKLLEIARKLGVSEIRFKSTLVRQPTDYTSPSVVRDSNKCILCGNCVRACAELQSIGAIDFAGRGAHARVVPAFGNGLGEGVCVGCGNCITVCPVGALSIKSQEEDIWKVLNDPTKTVVAAVAPAVRSGLGDVFNLPAEHTVTPQMVAALKRVGFKNVYDISFTADLTIFEEATEFIGRKTKGEKLPLFTSCCPAWVKFAEQFFPSLLPNLSTAKSPMQMFGSVARRFLPEILGCKPEDLVIVGVMPCTAKQGEAKLDKFEETGRQPIDYVLTTVGLGHMIEAKGLNFADLPDEEFDMPLGMRSGAGEIFGASGGVTEAALRYAVEKLIGKKADECEYTDLRGDFGVREVKYSVAGIDIKLAVVSGLANARKVCEKVVAGEADYDMIEVMTCPGGCLNGGGQPPAKNLKHRQERAAALYESDRKLIRTSQENTEVQNLYTKYYGEPNSEKAHHDLHTSYENRHVLPGAGFEAVLPNGKTLKVAVVNEQGMNCPEVGKNICDAAAFLNAKGVKTNIAPFFVPAAKVKGTVAVVNDEVMDLAKMKSAIEVLL